MMSRILAQTGVPQLVTVLAEELSPSDLQSLLLSVYRKRVETVPASRLLTQAERSGLLAPAGIDALS